MNRKIKLTLASVGVGAVTTLVSAVAPVSAQAAQTTRLTASDYGNAIYYSTGAGVPFKRFQRGDSRTFDSNDNIKTSGQSFAIVRGLYRITCFNVSPNRGYRVPVNEDDGILQAYPKTGCRN